MNIFLILAFLFFIGASLGWVLELFFRRFFSSENPERKWINPGFLVGPYVPLYGVGLCLLYLLAQLEQYTWIANPFWNRALLFTLMAIAMTVIEYIAGILLLKVMKLRLWDYSKQRGNIQGLICPKFSLAWALLGAAYYFFVHPYILESLAWLAENLAFSFFIGVFFGVFCIDLVYSTQIAVRIKKFAQSNDVIVRYEKLKSYLKQRREELEKKRRFFLSLHSESPLTEHMRQYYAQRREEFEARRKK